jgi:predicted Ser/Thr protein kinase
MYITINVKRGYEFDREQVRVPGRVCREERKGRNGVIVLYSQRHKKKMKKKRQTKSKKQEQQMGQPKAL